MPEPMNPKEIMELASKAAPVDAQQVYRVIDTVTSRQFAAVNAKLDRILAAIEQSNALTSPTKTATKK